MYKERNIDIDLINDLEKRMLSHITPATVGVLKDEIEWTFKLLKVIYKIARNQTALSLHDALGELGDLSLLVTRQLDEEIRKKLKEE